MRKHLPILFFTTLSLSACGSRQGLPSDEVLKRAAQASQTLQSATFNGDGTIAWRADSESHAVTAKMSGALQDSGMETKLQLQLNGDIPGPGQVHDLSAALNVISLGTDEVYLNIQELETKPPHPLLAAASLDRVIGQWWRAGTGGTTQTTQDISPDPQLLRMQAEVVKVLKDHGIRRLGDHDVYQYDVGIDTQKLKEFLRRIAQEKGEEFRDEDVDDLLQKYNATGTLYIDAEQFYVREVAWHILTRDDAAQNAQTDGIDLQIALTFDDHNAAEPIVPPSDYKDISGLLEAAVPVPTDTAPASAATASPAAVSSSPSQ